MVTTLFAYMMTGTKDLEPWIRFQLNTHSKQSALIKETHQPKVETEQKSAPTSYATGWFVDESAKDVLVYHPGTLENYSSYIILNPKKITALSCSRMPILKCSRTCTAFKYSNECE